MPTIYCNHANPSLSFHDVRIYLGEVMPKQLNVVVSEKLTQPESTIEPRICVVVSPEFAKALGHTLLGAVEKYENVFGPLRPPVTQEQVAEKINPKT